MEQEKKYKIHNCKYKMFFDQLKNLNRKTVLPAIVVIVFVALIAGNIFLTVRYLKVESQYQACSQRHELNSRVIDFSKLFIEKVLKAKTAISFEDRLNLENAVRNLKDPAILAQWEKFTEVTTQEQAQEEVKNLLDLLVNKFSY